jgi:hypothetical protein
VIGINIGGRLGNHLFSFSWMIAMARATGGIALNPAFVYYKQHFESTAKQRVSLWPLDAELDTSTRLLSSALSRRALKVYIHFRIGRQWRLDEAKPWLRWVPGLKNEIGYIAHDWLIEGRHAEKKLGPTFQLENGEPDFFSDRVKNYIRSKHRTIFDSAAILNTIPSDIVETVRQYFVPLQSYREAADTWLTEMRSRADVIVGVAVRQGDFRTWAGGSWFVAPDQFQRILRAFQEQLPGRRCLFALSSDEPITAEEFPGLDAVAIPSDSMVQLCTLMKCDYIIGTAQSTFIQWASFLGNVPWYPVAQNTVASLPEIDQLQVFGIEPPQPALAPLS